MELTDEQKQALISAALNPVQVARDGDMVVEKRGVADMVSLLKHAGGMATMDIDCTHPYRR